jgi:DNA invertase Pin-like site-specific DNA recombinase
VPVAYSYVRFSTPQQKLGGSARRHLENARKWAAEHGYTLDETLIDDGASASQGRNILGDGPLAQFARAVEQGRVEIPSVLVMESLDRFTRRDPWDALPSFQALLNAGVAIVTLIDGKLWTRERMRGNAMAILESIFVMARAHEESETKSKRNKEKWERRRTVAEEGGDVVTARAPGWLTAVPEVGPDGEPAIVDGKAKRRWEPIPQRVAVVRRIYRLAARGAGLERIARALTRGGIPCWGTGRRVGQMWSRTQVRAILKSRATRGFYTPHLLTQDDKGMPKRVPLDERPNYFPDIFADDPELARKVHAMAITDGTTPPVREQSGAIRSSLAGLGQCASCGFAMSRVSKGGTKRAGRPRLVCTGAKFGKGCEQRKSLPADEVEEAVLGNIFGSVYPWNGDEALRVEVGRLRDTLQMLDQRVAEAAATVFQVERSEALAAELRRMEEKRDALRMELSEKARRAEVADRAFVSRRLFELYEMYQAGDRDPVRFNAVLRQVCDAVIVDVAARTIRMVWKTGEIGQEIHF